MFGRWIRWLLTDEAALVSWVSAGGVAALLAFVFHLTRDQEAAAAVISASLATIWTAACHTPPELALITGALATIGTAIGAFGFHPSAHAIALVGTFLGLVIGFLHRHSFPTARPVGHPAYAPPRPVTPA